jgi:hypothetical protein
LLKSDALRAEIAESRGRSLFVIGTADPHYDEDCLREVTDATGGEALVIAGANHTLEIEGDLDESLQALQRVVRAIESFVAA